MRSIVIAFDMSEKITCAMRFVKNPKGKNTKGKQGEAKPDEIHGKYSLRGKNKKYRLDKRTVQA